jgi:hypothetical protein
MCEEHKLTVYKLEELEKKVSELTIEIRLGDKHQTGLQNDFEGRLTTVEKALEKFLNEESDKKKNKNQIRIGIIIAIPALIITLGSAIITLIKEVL